MITLIKPLLVNITILFSFTFNANLFFPFQTKQHLSLKQRIIYGLIGAFGGLLCMFYPIETLGDTRFDLRMIAIFIITLYTGWLPGTIVLICTCFIRFLISGPFVEIGLTINLFALFIALLFRKIFLRSSNKYLLGTIAILCYISIYITLLSFSIHFLHFSFYIIYFTISYFICMALIFVIEKLIKINKQFEEMVYLDKLTMIGQLTASIAHEIRNPLTTVRGFIQFLSKETKDEQFKQFSPIILEELDRTNSIITNYLKMTKPEQFHLTDIPLHEVINGCVQLMRPYASYTNVSIEWEKNDPIFIRGDVHSLKQAIMNIIKNGIEAIEGQGIIKINVKPDYFKNKVQLRISDNGRGMSQEQLKQIGLPFYTTKSKGTGLGSMVTNKIIRDMNGSIEYESELGQGTKVTIEFPLLHSET
ncbi:MULTISPECIES: ATP-binding protein [Neobacillus]|uniref:ATP-binding protein n=1 Tax=Neobacillus TaxID=2675232 RepID=UPI0013D85E31|nr:ATP-binding protein [Neobacillus sedimentimangrovi]